MNGKRSEDDIIVDLLMDLLRPYKDQIRKKYKWRLRWEYVKTTCQIYCSKVRDFFINT